MLEYVSLRDGVYCLDYEGRFDAYGPMEKTSTEHLFHVGLDGSVYYSKEARRRIGDRLASLTSEMNKARKQIVERLMGEMS